MPVPTQKTILFDLGGVLIDWNPRYLYRQIYGEAETEFFLANVCTAQWNLAIDAGRPFAEAVAERQLSWPEYREAILWWETRWSDMLKGPIPETVDLLRQVKDRGHRLFALTNWSGETFHIARERFEFLTWFEDIVVSGEVKLVKPDPAIFRLAQARCGFTPEGTLFIDDSPGNVDAARSLGYDGIHFKGAEALRLSLLERGCLA